MSEYYQGVELRLRATVDLLDQQLPADDRAIVCELLDHNELGLALDQIAYAIEEYGVVVSDHVATEISALAVLMDPTHSRLSPSVYRIKSTS